MMADEPSLMKTENRKVTDTSIGNPDASPLLAEATRNDICTV